MLENATYVTKRKNTRRYRNWLAAPQHYSDSRFKHNIAPYRSHISTLMIMKNWTNNQSCGDICGARNEQGPNHEFSAQAIIFFYHNGRYYQSHTTVHLIFMEVNRSQYNNDRCHVSCMYYWPRQRCSRGSYVCSYYISILSFAERWRIQIPIYKIYSFAEQCIMIIDEQWVPYAFTYLSTISYKRRDCNWPWLE